MEGVTYAYDVDDVASKMALSLTIGLLVGFEREWAHKEVGVRTFAVMSLLGTLSWLVSPALAQTAFFGVFLAVLLLNGQSLLKDRSLEPTTSAAMMLIFVLGALVGSGHYFTGATGAILLTMLLAWKVEMVRFADKLQPNEIRGAVLLGLLTFVIYPLLPNRFIDGMELFNPRQAWVNVVVIAGIGFVNYILLRLYRARGLYYAAFLGGLVNSTLTVVELSPLLRAPGGEYDSESERILFLPSVAMFLRNLLLLAVLAPSAAHTAALPLLSMTAVATILAVRERSSRTAHSTVTLPSPVELRRIAKTGILFVTLAAVGTLSQRYFGAWGFLAVSVLGGLVSSASAAATAASLAASGAVSPEMAGTATLFASIASSMGNLPLIYDETRDAALVRRLSIWTCLCAMVGLATSFGAIYFLRG